MRIRRAGILAVALLCLLGLPGFGWAAMEAPDAGKLLDEVLSEPKTSYQGHMTVTHWYGKSARAEEVRVFFDPPNRYRWEFLAPDGAPERIVISDGSREQVELVRSRKRFIGEPVKNYQKLMGDEKEKELLLRNYSAVLAGQDSMAGRSCWILEIVPKEKDKHRQRVWIDQQTGVVMQTRRFRPEGRFTTLSRFVSFEPANDLPDELFLVGAGSGPAAEHGLDPLAMSREEFRRSFGPSFDPPEELPGGFVFESANALKVRGRNVWHLRYTDGLASLSLFLTDGAVRLPAGGKALETAMMVPGGLPRMYGFGKVLEWSRGSRRYVLIGDADKSWLERIAAKIP